ncbi:MAG: hypothetical protein QG664_413 [Patescibacteria group bacterium]|nr:hypothetical protein [Patescibacteria group bacterium]
MKLTNFFVNASLENHMLPYSSLSFAKNILDVKPDILKYEKSGLQRTCPPYRKETDSNS